MLWTSFEQQVVQVIKNSCTITFFVADCCSVYVHFKEPLKKCPEYYSTSVTLTCCSCLQLGAHSEVCQWAIREIPERGAACQPQEENTWHQSPLLHLLPPCNWTQVSTQLLLGSASHKHMAAHHSCCFFIISVINLIHKPCWVVMTSPQLTHFTGLVLKTFLSSSDLQYLCVTYKRSCECNHETIVLGSYRDFIKYFPSVTWLPSSYLLPCLVRSDFWAMFVSYQSQKILIRSKSWEVTLESRHIALHNMHSLNRVSRHHFCLNSKWVWLNGKSVFKLLLRNTLDTFLHDHYQEIRL